MDHTAIPTKDRMLGWIEQIVAQGIRRPGYPADRWTEMFIREAFAEFGLQDVRFEPVALPGWNPRRCELRAWPTEDPESAITLTGFQLPHTTTTAGVEADLVPLDGGPVDGQLAVDELTLLEIPLAMMAPSATSAYDPDGAFATYVQTMPFAAQLQEVLEPAIAAGAAGYLGLLSGFPWETCDYYVPYDGEPRPLPAAWFSKSDAARLTALMSAGPVRGRLIAEATRAQTTCQNVIGTLPGRGDEWVVIASHHDGPWASAVEDASGVALVLAQAAYWSQVPAEQRPHNLLFLVTAGHMVAGAGTQEFIRAHRDLMDRIVLEVHLEHTARRVDVADDGRLVPTDDPEVRWWFTTRNVELEAVVHQALADNDLRRSLVLKPDFIASIPTTDGGFFHGEGVPLVNFISAPMYLFDSQDTLDKIHEDSLVPVTTATAAIVAWTAQQTAASIRAGVVDAHPESLVR